MLSTNRLQERAQEFEGGRTINRPFFAQSQVKSKKKRLTRPQIVLYVFTSPLHRESFAHLSAGGGGGRGAAPAAPLDTSLG